MALLSAAAKFAKANAGSIGIAAALNVGDLTSADNKAKGLLNTMRDFLLMRASIATGFLGLFMMMRNGIRDLVRSSGALEAAIKRMAAIQDLTKSLTTLSGGIKKAREEAMKFEEFAKSKNLSFSQVSEAAKNLNAFAKGALSGVHSLNTLNDAAASTGNSLNDLTNAAIDFADAAGSGGIGGAAKRLEDMKAISAEAAQRFKDMERNGASAAEMIKAMTTEMEKFAGAAEKGKGSIAGTKARLAQSQQELVEEGGKPFVKQEQQAVEQQIMMNELKKPVIKQAAGIGAKITAGKDRFMFGLKYRGLQLAYGAMNLFNPDVSKGSLLGDAEKEAGKAASPAELKKGHEAVQARKKEARETKKKQDIEFRAGQFTKLGESVAEMYHREEAVGEAEKAATRKHGSRESKIIDLETEKARMTFKATKAETGLDVARLIAQASTPEEKARLAKLPGAAGTSSALEQRAKEAYALKTPEGEAMGKELELQKQQAQRDEARAEEYRLRAIALGEEVRDTKREVADQKEAVRQAEEDATRSEQDAGVRIQLLEVERKRLEKAAAEPGLPQETREALEARARGMGHDITAETRTRNRARMDLAQEFEMQQAQIGGDGQRVSDITNVREARERFQQMLGAGANPMEARGGALAFANNAIQLRASQTMTDTNRAIAVSDLARIGGGGGVEQATGIVDVAQEQLRVQKNFDKTLTQMYAILATPFGTQFLVR